MNNFDIVIFVILLIFALIGAWRGFVHELITLITWALSIMLAWRFASPLAGLFEGVADDPALRKVLAFVLIFIVVFILGILASWLIHKYLPSKRGFRIANIALGGLFGAVRGGLIVIAIFIVAGLTSFPQRPWWRESTCTPFFERSAVYVASYLPRDIARFIRYG
jgi:membrane protein required for colicin V production